MTDLAGKELQYKLGKRDYNVNYSVATGSCVLKEKLMAILLF
jgi:hypothetical protein